jgi:uncharacterized metal-binding protein YceD (DUF177 family)
MKIFIQGLRDGEYPVEIESKVENIPELPEELIGVVRLIGTMKILHKRYTIQAKILSRAKFICDISLEDFEEDLECDFSISLVASNVLATDKKDRDDSESSENFIFEDEKYITLTSEIREELIVNLPLKRVAPKYREKSLEDIYPQFVEKIKEKTKKDSEFDDRWSSLKNLKFN